METARTVNWLFVGQRKPYYTAPVTGDVRLPVMSEQQPQQTRQFLPRENSSTQKNKIGGVCVDSQLTGVLLGGMSLAPSVQRNHIVPTCICVPLVTGSL